MKRLQHWFDIVAGIAHDEQLRREQAHAIFANTGPNIDALQTPACWRRRARIYAA